MMRDPQKRQGLRSTEPRRPRTSRRTSLCATAKDANMITDIHRFLYLQTLDLAVSPFYACPETSMPRSMCGCGACREEVDYVDD
jgi:hypothetical protein